MSSVFSLDPYFTLWFIFLLALAFFLRKKFSQATNVPTTAEFKLFQDNFVLVYIFVVAADWLQGPYVYALYDAYGFTQQVLCARIIQKKCNTLVLPQDIGILFIVGFGSSAVFGTFAGMLQKLLY